MALQLSEARMVGIHNRSADLHAENCHLDEVDRGIASFFEEKGGDLGKPIKMIFRRMCMTISQRCHQFQLIGWVSVAKHVVRGGKLGDVVANDQIA